MTYAFNDITVTTWRRTSQGEQVWRVRGGKLGDRVAEFVADRDSDPLLLYGKGIVALGDIPHVGET